MDVTIGETRERASAFVDTGSDVSCISWSFWDTLGASRSPSKVPGLTANNEPLQLHGVSRLPISWKDHEPSLEDFTVVERLFTDILIGANMIDRYGLLKTSPRSPVYTRQGNAAAPAIRVCRIGPTGAPSEVAPSGKTPTGPVPRPVRPRPGNPTWDATVNARK
jgi:hypothetical protein